MFNSLFKTFQWRCCWAVAQSKKAQAFFLEKSSKVVVENGGDNFIVSVGGDTGVRISGTIHGGNDISHYQGQK